MTALKKHLEKNIIFCQEEKQVEFTAVQGKTDSKFHQAGPSVEAWTVIYGSMVVVLMDWTYGAYPSQV